MSMISARNALVKHPLDEKEYVFSFAKWLACRGDTVAEPIEILVEPVEPDTEAERLEVGTPEKYGDYALRFTLAGGVNGRDYLLTFGVETTLGEKDYKAGLLKVRDR